MPFRNILDFPTWLSVSLTILAVWSIVWKGLALWKAGNRRDKAWFIVLFVVNTFGILEILYYFVISEKKIDFNLKLNVDHDHSGVKEEHHK